MTFGTRDPRNLKHVSVRLPADNVEWLKSEALRSRTTVSELVRVSVAAFISDDLQNGSASALREHRDYLVELAERIGEATGPMIELSHSDKRLLRLSVKAVLKLRVPSRHQTA